MIKALIRTIIFSCLLSFLSFAAFAQQDDKVVVRTNLISVNISATNANGKFVSGLKRGQFEIFDNKVKQQIAYFTDEESPFSLGIIYDSQGASDSRLKSMLNALKQFVNSLDDKDDYFVLVFNERGSLMTDFVPNVEQVQAQLSKNPNSLYDAMNLAFEKSMSARNAKKAILIISDGADNNSNIQYKELSKRVNVPALQFYAITISEPETDAVAGGVGRWVYEDLTGQTGRRPFFWNLEASLGRAVMDDLARATGGATYSAENKNDLEFVGICIQIAEELRRQYTIAFYPAEENLAYGQHKIKVRLNSPKEKGKVFLSYRQIYRNDEN